MAAHSTRALQAEAEADRSRRAVRALELRLSEQAASAEKAEAGMEKARRRASEAESQARAQSNPIQFNPFFTLSARLQLRATQDLFHSRVARVEQRWKQACMRMLRARAAGQRSEHSGALSGVELVRLPSPTPTVPADVP